MTDKFLCPKHEMLIGPEPCEPCVMELMDRPARGQMTPADRVTELHALLNEPNTAGFMNGWHRVDELLGRGTYTHELAHPEALEAEILSGQQPNDIEIVMKLKNGMGDKPVVVIDSGSGESYTV